MEKSGKFYASDTIEHYPVGPCETVDEAIAEYRKEYGAEPKRLGESREVFCHIDGGSLLEDLANGSLYEELYEDALNGWCEFKHNDTRLSELSERLTSVLHQWLDEVGEAKSWAVVHEIDMTHRREPSVTGRDV